MTKGKRRIDGLRKESEGLNGLGRILREREEDKTQSLSSFSPMCDEDQRAPFTSLHLPPARSLSPLPSESSPLTPPSYLLCRLSQPGREARE